MGYFQYNILYFLIEKQLIHVICSTRILPAISVTLQFDEDKDKVVSYEM